MITYHWRVSYAAEFDSNPDIVRTVTDLTTASTLVQGSKFLAVLGPASSESNAEDLLHLRARRYPDASHHCWAFRLGRPSELLERSADAGEPAGTAGRPILDALRGARLENVVCVISRYFGGTKLGTGGLVRAYAEAANAVIAGAAITEKTIVRVVALDFDHERTGIVYRALEEFGLHFLRGHYDERAHGVVEIPSSKVSIVQRRIRELARSGVDWDERELKLT